MADRKQESSKLAKRLGERVSSRRKQLGWTQEQLAERMRVDAETISRFERGVNLPSLLTLDRLAAVLKVDIGELTLRKEPNKLDPAGKLAMLLADLPPSDQTFVVQQVSIWCEYLRSRSKR